MHPARMFYWLVAVIVLLISVLSARTLPAQGQSISNSAPAAPMVPLSPQLTPTLPPPDITVNPTLLTVLHTNSPEVTTQTLTIGNTGGSTLMWTINENENRPVLPESDTTQSSAIHHSVPSIGLAPSTRPSSTQNSTDHTSLGATGAYAYRYRYTGMGIVGLNLADPGSQTVITPTQRTLFAGDFANNDYDTLYALDGETYEFLTVDTNTGAETVVGVSSTGATESWTGMTWDATTNTMYGSATNCANSSLYTINIATGASTLIGPVTNAPCLIDIAVSPSGQLYGVDIENDVLVAINKSTGAGTVIGPIGFDANFAQDLDFDDENNVLYYAAFNNGEVFNGELRTVNLVTGATTLVGAFGTETIQIDAFGITSNGISCSVATDIPWLAVSPASGNTGAGNSASVTVTFDSTGLNAGVYNGTLCIDTNDPDEPFVNVPVTLEVRIATPTPTPTATPDPTQPEIVVSPAVIEEFHEQYPNPEVTTQTLSISNIGGVNLTWTLQEMGIPPLNGGTCGASTDIEWLTASPISGTTLPGTTDSVIVTLDSTGLQGGTYEAALCIENNDTDEPAVMVPVTLVFLQPTAIEQALWTVGANNHNGIWWMLGLGLVGVGVFIRARHRS